MAFRVDAECEQRGDRQAISATSCQVVTRRRSLTSLGGFRSSVIGRTIRRPERYPLTLSLAADRRNRPLKFNAHHAGWGVALCELLQLVHVRRRPRLP